MPKCTINGVDLEVKQGTTIIEAMHSNQQAIAHYCWHPGLSVAGVCRLCMVEIEGNPRVQIACNTTITEGMKINNTSAKVKDAAKWGLDFHLINHPLDCPVCDQAGECGLQEQYMEFGKYDPEMAEHKVKKHKVVDLGPTVVLDSERCILCSRCVRFTTEVTKTEELGIFNRGDRSEIGTFDGKKLDNNYSLNTVDICPVGALTSKDFRFKQRVWYLKEAETVCNGCSTGCNVKTYFNKEGFFRVKPVHNADVNGYWMCDTGRDFYKFVNREVRLLKARKKTANGYWDNSMPGAAAKDASATVVASAKAGQAALVVTGQYTVEEYETLFTVFVKELGVKTVYHWWPHEKESNEFDGILLRGDKNPNTKGLLEAAQKAGVTFVDFKTISDKVADKSVQTVLVAGPEIQGNYKDWNEKFESLSKAKNLVWMQSTANSVLDKAASTADQSAWVIPMKSFVEKDGTFVNHQGLKQTFKKATTIVSEALTLSEATDLIAGKNLMMKYGTPSLVESERPADRVMLEQRKKNEYVFKRGSL